MCRFFPVFSFYSSPSSSSIIAVKSFINATLTQSFAVQPQLHSPDLISRTVNFLIHSSAMSLHLDIIAHSHSHCWLVNSYILTYEFFLIIGSFPIFICSLPSCFLLLLLRVMGKNHPVNGGHRAPALTAPWGAMGGTPRLVPLRTTADQVLAKPHNPYITVAL